MRFMNRRTGFLALPVALVLCSAAMSQTTTSRLDGSVKDQTGAAIFGATVTLTNVTTNETITTTTNEQGLFVFPQVRSGLYRVIAEASGFKKTAVENVKVDVGIPTTVNFTLEVGAITESVEVTASEGQTVINTVSAELNTIITRRQILDLPLNGRNPLQLAGLQAGVAGNAGVRTSVVNGLRGSFNNITQDGINIQDNFVRTDGFFGLTAPNVENVAEFSITTQNVSSVDGFGVAQVKLVTPSGGNEYHGSAFWFHRNTSLDANTFFNNAIGLPREKLIRNEFGVSASGPVFRDKLFFFGYYRGFRERSASALLRTVLTGPARQGLFTYRRQDNGQLQTVNLLQLGGVTPDPVTTRLIGLTPTPNDFTTGDRLNFAGFRFNSGVINDNDLWGFRVDYHPLANHQFEAVFSQFHSRFPNDTFNDIGEPFPGLPGGGQRSLRQLGSFAWRWTPRATLNNEFRWGFQRAPVAFINREPFASGFRLDFPLVTDPVQNFLNQGRNSPVFEWIDNATWVKDNHSFRFGGQWRRVHVDSFNDAGIIPIFTLGFNQTGNPNPLSRSAFPGGISTNDFNNASSILAILGGFLNDVSQTFNVTSRTSGFVSGASNVRQLRQNIFAFHGGDTWRVRPNLTFSYGIRYEWYGVPTEANSLALLPKRRDQGVVFDPNAVFDFAGDDVGRAFFSNDNNNFAPSFSFSWDPFGTGKTAIRAGYSLSYVVDNNLTTVSNAVNSNQGLQQTAVLRNLSGSVGRGGIITVPPPAFKVPRTLLDNQSLDFANGLFTLDDDLRVPYVQQWTLSIQREIARDTVAEIRYVGNHAVKLTRALDFNQVIVRENGFVEDVLRAQRNLAATGDPARGEPLQIFPRLGLGGLLSNATIRNLIAQGEAGQLAAIYLLNANLFFKGFGGEQFGAQLTRDFFSPNPNALFTDLVTNSSGSTYHGLQAEVRRRFSQGLWAQFNYTFSKVLTDFEGSQTNFSAFLDIRGGRALELKRASFDVTHVFNFNFVYDLPIGPGRHWLGATGGLAGKLLGGWSITGIVQGRSGRPISIVSARGTVNRTGGGRSNKNTVLTSLTRNQLSENTGVFTGPNGEKLLFDPRLIGPDGRAKTDLFQNPNAGQLGTLGLTQASGPQFFNADFGLLKRTRFATPLNEQTELEFRAEFFNIFNVPNFFVGESHNINSTSFGRITQTFDPRIIQFAFKVNF